MWVFDRYLGLEAQNTDAFRCFCYFFSGFYWTIKILEIFQPLQKWKPFRQSVRTKFQLLNERLAHQVAYWCLYRQTPNTLLLSSDQQVDRCRRVLDLHVPFVLRHRPQPVERPSLEVRVPVPLLPWAGCRHHFATWRRTCCFARLFVMWIKVYSRRAFLKKKYELHGVQTKANDALPITDRYLRDIKGNSLTILHTHKGKLVDIFAASPVYGRCNLEAAPSKSFKTLSLGTYLWNMGTFLHEGTSLRCCSYASRIFLAFEKAFFALPLPLLHLLTFLLLHCVLLLTTYWLQ